MRVYLFRHLGTAPPERAPTTGNDLTTATDSSLADRPVGGGSGWSLEEIQEAEGDEEDRKHDGQPEERALDPPPAPVGGDLAAERAAQAGAPLLEQDGGDERDGEDHLGDDQGGLHGRRSLAEEAAAGHFRAWFDAQQLAQGGRHVGKRAVAQARVSM